MREGIVGEGFKIQFENKPVATPSKFKSCEIDQEKEIK